MSEQAFACITLSQELRRLDPNQATQAQLETLIHFAEERAPVCEALFLENARTRGEQAIARQEAQQISIQALLLRGALSTRFHGGEGYCSILDQNFQLLFGSLREAEELLNTSGVLSDDERSRLGELRDLELQGLDVLIIHRDENCRTQAPVLQPLGR